MDLLDLVIKKEAGSQVSLDHLPTSLAVSELPVPQEGNEGTGDFVLSMPDGYAPSLCHLSPQGPKSTLFGFRFPHGRQAGRIPILALKCC